MLAVRTRTTLPPDAARAIAAAMLAVALVLPGCYRKPTYTPPETYPVSGQVVPAGKVPANSLVKFIPPEGDLVAEGTIGPDGGFTLKTLFHEEWLPGAVAGANRSVQILVPLGVDQLGGQTIEIQQKYTVEPKENQFTVTLK